MSVWIGVVVVVLCAVPIAFSQSDSSELTVCQSNLKQYALGILMYQQDYDERSPPMKFAAQVQNRVAPYVKNRAIFACPTSGREYLPNPAMNYVTLGSIQSPATLMMLRDALPHTLDSGGKGWNIAYADGHVKLSNKEIPLGKPAPSPPPPRPMTRAQKIRAELGGLRASRSALDSEIRRLESQERRMRKR